MPRLTLPTLLVVLISATLGFSPAAQADHAAEFPQLARVVDAPTGADHVWVHLAPGYNRLGLLWSDTLVRVFSCNAEWCFVQADGGGTPGWVVHSQLRFMGPIEG